MLPNGPQNQPGEPNRLPTVSAGQSPAPAPIGPAGVPAASPETAAQYSEKAKQVIMQYGNDPYRLAEALNQLKAGYLSQQHHIMSNQAGS